MKHNCLRLLGSKVPPLVFSNSVRTARGQCSKCCRAAYGADQVPRSNNFLRMPQWMQVRRFSGSSRLGIDFTPKQMVVTTNINVWVEKPEGVHMEVTYIDTAADLPEAEAQNMPTILATHGCPGNHKDIQAVMEPLAKLGARVIMPNFPGYDFSYGVTEEDEDFYTHTTEERVQFLLQILSALNVNRVDMLMCHSAASWPLFFMASMMPNIKGIATICPGPGHTPPRSSRPEWLMVLLSRGWDRHWLRPFLKLTVLALVKPVSGIGYGKVAHIIAAMRTAAGFQFSIMPSVMQQIKSKNLSMVQFMCKRDVLIEYDLSTKSAEMLGYPDKAVDFYDSSGNLESKGEMPEDRYAKRVVFDLKTHYPQKKSAFLPIIQEELCTLYKYITKSEAMEESPMETETGEEEKPGSTGGLNFQAKFQLRNR